MSEVGYFCPACTSTEIEITESSPLMLGIEPRKVRCRLCGWKGSAEDVIGALAPTNEVFWTPERIGNAMLIAASKHAAGPMVQLLEVIGLVPKIEGSPEEAQSARDIREAVVKAVLEAVVTAAFETAGYLAPSHNERFHPELVPAINHAVGIEGPADSEAPDVDA